jgi:hypothetical protein
MVIEKATKTVGVRELPFTVFDQGTGPVVVLPTGAQGSALPPAE